MASIGLDFDGVITDMINPLLKISNRTYNENLTKDDITTYRLPDKLRNIFRYKQDFFCDLPMIPGALEGIKELALKHRIVFITNPSKLPHIAHDKMVWWKKTGLDKWPLIITDVKHFIDVDILIDDSPDNIEMFALNKNKHGLLMTHKYNEHIDYRVNNIHRVHNWEEIIAKVEMLTNGDNRDTKV